MIDEYYRDLLAANLETVDRVVASVARRHRLTADERDELGSLVRFKLVDRDYAVLRQFAGRSRFETYLTTVIARIALDARTARWGKWRASSEARRRGPVAVLLERLVIRDGMTLDEADEIIRTNYGVTASRGELESVYAALPRRCRRRMLDETVLRTVPAPQTNDAGAGGSGEDHDTLMASLCHAVATLTPGDRRLVQLRFTDGWTVARIAASVDQPARVVYRRFDRILRHLRRSFAPEIMSRRSA
jgi:RNA polymerase sigma factor for flagellar operon FliA